MQIVAGNKSLNSRLSADNQVMFAQYHDGIQYTLKIINKYEKWRLSINLGKIKYMCIRNTSAVIDMEIRNCTKKHCRKIRFLAQ